MSTLLKAHRVRLENGHKRLAAEAAHAPRPASDAPLASPDPRAAEIAELTARVAELEAACAALESAQQAAYLKGIDEGGRAADARAKRDDDARIDVLSRGLQDAHSELQVRFASLESLALDVARAALEQMFGAIECYPTLIAQTIRHHVAHMRAGTVLTVDVSRADFPDDDALLPIATAAPDSVVTAHPHLPAGACRLGLTPGRAELDLPRQCGRLLAALDPLRSDDDPNAA
ncbi:MULTISPECIES: hypothetical protein [Burkholderia]|uniref:Flagellar assembly protein FliH/Type III secretion system HrpE domain-containing protein n=1 Tax=Burkholderia pyrrocinia TaxID=60550 RepID=A0A318IPK9_BURPY|nr:MULTISPECIES: hypothetical protein [Burkholderia]PXX35447.1 hypothetical protein NA66_100687 [Burkholderia pyrrocinia]SFW41802.1 hypothetical protein SAMN03159384_01912 [Burkholderia sp. NFACC33-1]SFX71163.1 hypothetical protein SAMN03159408_01994 [Burkholderia sp. NFPP32]